jgi:GGDEF domain-containing protein
MDVRINHFDAFKETYGFVAGGDVLRFMAMLVNEILDELGTPNDFVGHAGGDNFILVTAEGSAQAIRQRLKTRFVEEVKAFYNFLDREQGYIIPSRDGKGEKAPLMSLAIGVVSPTEYQFADIREITELAAEARRRDQS